MKPNKEAEQLVKQIEALKAKIANETLKIANLTQVRDADEGILSQMEVKLNLLNRLEELK